ncbi:LamG-like jellyroll fold domain-containing protein [Flavivirga eckloniae]|uniref:LamG-like jellyroll fold domain-containing protein n=1 Tax=Flavivirga eckloniae TaxID=1803846 RepID=A0A2K9PM19_9FLAO|nr:LamG-like jellyroll fold domain-containing protein [Flavivirga eckloniae]AUP78113.1 hypothetical protein C1H87_05030 [Flavivirga eckloniae]
MLRIFSRKSILVICFTAIVLLVNTVNAQHLSSNSYLIGDFENAKEAINYFEEDKSDYNIGFSIHINYALDSNELYVESSDSYVTFQQYVEALKVYLDKNPSKVVPLFINYEGPENWLKQVLNKANLDDYCFFLPAGEKWPNLEEIRDTGKRLIIFSFHQTNDEDKIINYAWDHIAEFPFTNFDSPIFEGYYSNGKPENELLLLRHFEKSNIEKSKIDESWLNLSENNFSILHAIKCWQLCGKRPNFIMVEGKHIRKIYYLNYVLRDFPSISGVVSYRNKPLEQVFWENKVKAITNGYYSFPVVEDEAPVLRPYQHGYSFRPSNIQVTEEYLKKGVINFTAFPLSLDEELTGAFTFNGKINNLIKPASSTKNFKCEFAKDIVKGEVLKFQDSSYAVFGIPDDFGIRKSSFTISLNIKLSELDLENDYFLIGANEKEYRKSLHVNIRKGIPYFGFYGSDVSVYKKLEPSKWYNLVVRYDIKNQEQSIFINGKQHGSSTGHPSYIGESELMLGRGFIQEGHLSGYIDDLYIWNRALSNNEIKTVFSDGVKVEKKNNLVFIFLTLITLVVLALVILMVVRRRRSVKFQTTRVKSFKTSEILGSKINTITLFGGFRVYDKHGKDITLKFPPKIKELFLIILLYSVKSTRGISSQKITNIIWHGFSTKKASNNRSVSFNKLRSAISDIEGISINFESGYWKITWNESFICDYLRVSSILKQLDKSRPEKYKELFQYVKSGKFLENSNWEWLEEFQTSINFDVVDALNDYALTLDELKEQAQAFEVYTLVIKIDDLNEQALQYIVSYLKSKESQTRARYYYDKFCEKYFEAYDEKYHIEFQDLI